MSDKYPPPRGNKNYRYNNSNQSPNTNSNPNTNPNQNHNQGGKFNGLGGTGTGAGDGNNYRSTYSGYNNTGQGHGHGRYKNESSLPNEQRFEGRQNNRMNRGNRSHFNYPNDRNDSNGNGGDGLNIQRKHNNTDIPLAPAPAPTPAPESESSVPTLPEPPVEIDTSAPPKEFDKWEDLEGILNEDIMRGVYSYGFDSPSLIQRKALLTMFDRRDIIAQAQSGTGKTGVFTIGVLQNINPEINKTQGLIMAPTRELAKQIYEVISSIGSVNKSIKYHLLIGGTSTDDDAFELKITPPYHRRLPRACI